jgi:hypothetical protein
MTFVIATREQVSGDWDMKVAAALPEGVRQGAATASRKSAHPAYWCRRIRSPLPKS